MAAPTVEEFDADVERFLQAYTRDFDDPGITAFNSITPYATR